MLLTAALVGGILWLSGSAEYRKSYDIYLAYMNESVSGLNVNAPVKYRGVEIGRVKRISLVQGERVRLELEIEHGTPIKEDTVAVLRVQGLTGIAQVELAGSRGGAPTLKAKPGEEYPVIKTGPSLLTRLDSAVTDMLSSLNRVSDSINSVLDEENRRAFKKLVADLATISGTLAQRKESMEATLQNLASTADNTAKASAELPRLMERVSKSAQALEKMAADASRASAAVRKTMGGVDGGMAQLNDRVLPELDLTLSEMRELSTSFKRLSEEVERNPNMLLLGKQAAEPGPGE